MTVRGVYEHYRGGLYRVLDIGICSETKDELVIYTPKTTTGDRPLWVRPRKMFEENVEWQGKTVPRFKLIHEAVAIRKRDI